MLTGWRSKLIFKFEGYFCFEFMNNPNKINIYIIVTFN